MFLFPLVATLMSCLCSGPFLARLYGHRGSALISVLCLLISFLSSLFIWYEVAFGACEVYMDLFGSWFTVGSFNVYWNIYVDLTTAHMLLTVTSVSFAVHCYAVVYMQSDPHLNLFMSYLSLFTFFMVVLVCSDNLVMMLIGWEGIGVCSYLLIGYWSHRLAAVKSAQKAILVNRVSDGLLLWGVLWVWWYTGALEYDLVCLSAQSSTFLSLAILIGAMGKSAQIGFHVWLADAMEGELYYYTGNALTRFYTTNKNNIEDFHGFTQHQKEVLAVIMFSDGHLRNPNAHLRSTGNFRLECTFKTGHLDFCKWVKLELLANILTSTAPTPYPRENPTQYWFSTRSNIFFTQLRSIWYVSAPKKGATSSPSELRSKVVHTKILPAQDYEKCPVKRSSKTSFPYLLP